MDRLLLLLMGDRLSVYRNGELFVLKGEKVRVYDNSVLKSIKGNMPNSSLEGLDVKIFFSEFNGEWLSEMVRFFSAAKQVQVLRFEDACQEFFILTNERKEVKAEKLRVCDYLVKKGEKITIKEAFDSEDIKVDFGPNELFNLHSATISNLSRTLADNTVKYEELNKKYQRLIKLHQDMAKKLNT